MADLSPSSAVYWWTAQQNSLSDYSNVKAWYDRVINRPSWQKVLKESEPYLQKVMGG